MWDLGFVRAFRLVVILLPFVRQVLVNKFPIGNVDEHSIHLRPFSLLNRVIYCPVVTEYFILSTAGE
jgi:hypothetical protein